MVLHENIIIHNFLKDFPHTLRGMAADQKQNKETVVFQTHSTKSPKHKTCNKSTFIQQWRIQDFPQGGAPTSKSALIFQFCSRKLHENERIWTRGGGGGASLAPPLRSANVQGSHFLPPANEVWGKVIFS